MTYKVNITTSFDYGVKGLRFKRTFELPFVPFYGLTILFDDKNDYDVDLVNNDYVNTYIRYSTERNEFDVDISNYWKHPVRDDVVHGVLEQFSSWERRDSTDVEQFIDLMNKEQERRYK